MSTSLSPDTGAIAVAFGEEITALSGTVSDHCEIGGDLFLRAVLPQRDDVRPGDSIHGGVALRTQGPSILVHPYTFRLACTNGAIVSQVVGTHEVRRVEYSSAVEFVAAALSELRLIVRRCAEPDTLRRTVRRMRAAAELEADFIVQLLPMMSRIPVASRERVMHSILRHFGTEERTVYGLMNAVTATARDTADPAARWDLETMGAMLLPPPSRRPLGSTAARQERETPENREVLAGV